MFQDNLQLRLETSEGDKTFDILYSFYSEKFNKKYMVICESDAETVNGQVRVMPVSYEADADGYIKEVRELETLEEFEHVKSVFEAELARYRESQIHDHDHECACGGHCEGDCE